MYEEYENELNSILNDANGRGNSEFYAHLENRLEALSNKWSDNNLTRDEITKLIERKHFIINQINTLK